MLVAIKLLVVTAFLALAYLIARRRGNGIPAPIRSALEQHHAFSFAGSHWLLRGLRVDEYAPLSRLWWIALLLGFAPVTALCFLEGSLYPNDPTSFSFLGTIADPVNYAILVPLSLIAGVSFIHAVPVWFKDLHDNLIPKTDEDEHAFSEWIRQRANTRIFRLFTSRAVSAVVYAVCWSFPAWAYYSVNQARQIYGFDRRMPTLGGVYVSLILGTITYYVVVVLSFVLLTLVWFKDVCDKLGSRFNVNPLHPDGCAGFLFAGRMSAGVVGVFFLSALMSGALIARDIRAGLGGQPYHWATTVLFAIVVVVALPPLLKSHGLLVRARDHWTKRLWNELSVENDALHDVTQDLQWGWVERMKAARELVRDFPTWPMNRRVSVELLVSIIGSGLGILLSALGISHGGP